MRLSAPAHHTVKMQSYGRVRISINTGNPGICKFDINTKLFAQFAIERIRDRFARFDFSTGKFPIAFINLAGWTLRQKEPPIGMFDYCSRDIHHALRHGMAAPDQDLFRAEPDVILWRPAQSRAKCQATRPLREPRV